MMIICIPQLKYKEDYNKNVKGQWCETPYFDVATARVAMENISSVSAYFNLMGWIYHNYISFSFVYISLLIFCPSRNDTRKIGRIRKTKFISCKQTRLFMERTRRLVLLLVR